VSLYDQIALLAKCQLNVVTTDHLLGMFPFLYGRFIAEGSRTMQSSIA